MCFLTLAVLITLSTKNQINGVPKSTVTFSKYLGVIFDNKLARSTYVDAIYLQGNTLYNSL